MTTAQKAIFAKVDECIAIAEAKFGITLPEIKVRIDLKGKSSGVASCRKQLFSNTVVDCEVRFNREHIAMGGATYDNLLNDTVAHEVAHIVCFAFPQLGRAHDKGWKQVCLALGGNGRRCYTEEDAPEAVAKQRPYVYTTTKGQEVRVTTRIHKKIQTGAAYIYRGMGSINQNCSFSYASSVKPQPKAKPLTTTKTKKVRAPKKGSKAELIRFQISVGLTFDECVTY
ncbi:MAG: SprT-like domain-containing protein, partial [Actinobacteria bacterium]|nr:SprT-like domain-containing protein [Actinomycetota bacterium]